MNDETLADGTCRYCQHETPGQHHLGCLWVSWQSDQQRDSQHRRVNIYRGSPAEDILIAGWWHRMEQDGDLARIFSASARSMGDLFRLVSKPKDLLYDYDEQGIWIAMWVEPLLDAACIGFWVRSDYRKSRIAAWVFLMYADFVLRLVPVIVGLTKQRDLVKMHEKFGYTVAGEIPFMYDGESAIVMVLTRAAFTAAFERLRRLNPALRHRAAEKVS